MPIGKFPANSSSKKSPANPPGEKSPASSPSKKSPVNPPRQKFPANPRSKKSPNNPRRRKLPASLLRKRSPAIMSRKSSGSNLVPLRGIGDSFLPFQESYFTNIEAAPQHFWFEKNMTKNAIRALDKGKLPLKKILFWNDVFGNKSFYFGYGQEPFIKANCPVSSCFTTANRSLFSPEEVDAVIWHARSDDQSLPSKRSPHTRYVFWSWESADHMFDSIQEFKNVFNWTFTYRLDSDIPNPYGTIYRRRVPKPQPVGKNYAAGKKKLAAWFVSNCDTKSGRERLVKKLKNWIKVDVYGQCGTHKCPWNAGKNSCYKKLERKYKFYFSFENSLCKNYATEKIFNVLRYNVVPVVYGLGNYTAILPPKSYVDALAFPTPENLASYLLYLNKNDTAYNEYFRWKAYHQLPAAWSSLANPWCDLCKRLHEDQSRKVYDIYEWFIKGSDCLNLWMPRISRFIKNKAPNIDNPEK
ncbi:alpha-(1,3)-fucosyltransferase C-like [Macrobrachium nipponense]|uniref:alpha-(1,3)-fucosyltransferase C-like n=1 Tax=Macrobrachium nipponense TaxID=159736 RepID=UPI0030C8997B